MPIFTPLPDTFKTHSLNGAVKKRDPFAEAALPPLLNRVQPGGLLQATQDFAKTPVGGRLRDLPAKLNKAHPALVDAMKRWDLEHPGGDKADRQMFRNSMENVLKKGLYGGPHPKNLEAIYAEKRGEAAMAESEGEVFKAIGEGSDWVNDTIAKYTPPGMLASSLKSARPFVPDPTIRAALGQVEAAGSIGQGAVSGLAGLVNPGSAMAMAGQTSLQPEETLKGLGQTFMAAFSSETSPMDRGKSLVAIASIVLPTAFKGGGFLKAKVGAWLRTKGMPDPLVIETIREMEMAIEAEKPQATQAVEAPREAVTPPVAEAPTPTTPAGEVGLGPRPLVEAKPEAVAAKEPWEMTRKEYAKARKDAAATGNEWRLPITYHQGYVANAFREGKPVPPEVLADYPDLKPVEAPKPETAPTAPTEGKVDPIYEVDIPTDETGHVIVPKTPTPKPGKGVRNVKKAGAVSLPTVSTWMRESVQSGKSLYSRLGNTFNRLHVLGNAGKVIAEGLQKQITINFGEETRDLLRIVKTYMGNRKDLPNHGKDLMRKVLNNEQLTVGEKALHDVWVNYVKKNARNAQGLGVTVGHSVGEKWNPMLAGEEARFYDKLNGGVEKRGTIVGMDGDKLVVKVGADEWRLSEHDPFYVRQLADPSTYFQMNLKDSIREQLMNPSSAATKEQVAHMMRTGKYANPQTASAALQKFRQSISADTPTIGPVTLERPRLSMDFPEHFYEYDFLKMAERKIKSDSRRLAQAAVWGKNGEKLNDLLQQISERHGEDEALSIGQDLRKSMGMNDPMGRGQRLLSKYASAEGAWTMLSKLTSGITTLRQLTSGASTVATSTTQGLLKGTLKVLTDKTWREEIRGSGASSQSVMELMGIYEDKDFAARIGNVAIKYTGIQALDKVMRMDAAAVTRASVEHLIKKVKFTPRGDPVKNAAWRYLNERVEYSVADIKQMASSGKLTPLQRDMAYQAGSKSQVQTHAAAMPPTLAGNPLGRIAFRLQSFNYGQAQVFGSIIIEASRGNVVPLLKGAAASIPIGEVVHLIVERMDRQQGKPDNNPDEKTLFDAIMDRDWKAAMSRSYADVLQAGTLGTYEVVSDAINDANDIVASGGSGARFMESRVAKHIPPGLRTVGSAISAAMDVATSADDFVTSAQQAGLNLTYDEVVAFKKLWNIYHEGESPRQESKPSKPSKPETLREKVVRVNREAAEKKGKKQ